jgi:excisionase family DNA binding protein
MVDSKLLTVPQVAEVFQVTAQTIRNWIDQGLLPAVRVGRAYRIRQDDVTKLMDRAVADSDSLATQRDPWVPGEMRLSPAGPETGNRSIWDDQARPTVLRRSLD